MAVKRIHIGLTPAQLRILDRLNRKLGLDTTNTIRYCVSRIAEQEGLLDDPVLSRRDGLPKRN
jgi:hypothetical protein